MLVGKKPSPAASGGHDVACDIESVRTPTDTSETNNPWKNHDNQSSLICVPWVKGRRKTGNHAAGIRCSAGDVPYLQVQDSGYSRVKSPERKAMLAGTTIPSGSSWAKSKIVCGNFCIVFAHTSGAAHSSCGQRNKALRPQRTLEPNAYPWRVQFPLRSSARFRAF